MKPSDDSLLNWLHLPGTPESFDVFRNFILEQAGSAGLPEDLRTRIDLVLEEVLLNVINHACKGSETEQVSVGCGIIPEMGFLLRVADPGLPFNPLEQPEPDTTLAIEQRKVGGLGILLVKNISREMGYRRRDHLNILDIYF